MLWLGIAATFYQMIGLRLYLPVEDALHRPDESGLAEQAMALRRAFDAFDVTNTRIPPDAIVQYSTQQPSDFFRFAQVMQANRQVATAFPQCDAAFGGDPLACEGVSRGSSGCLQWTKAIR